MAHDQERRYQSVSYQASATSNADFYPNHRAANNVVSGAVYSLHAAHRESSGALAPYYYQTDSSHGPRLGLIRGYHHHMYEPIPREGPCCDCAPDRSKGSQSSECCNWGVACGCVLLIIGVIAILMGFMVPQKPQKSRHLSHEERKELHQINLFIDIFVISGLSVLSIGGLLISLALLLPLLRRRTEHRCEEPIKYFGSEVYVKSEQLPLSTSGAPSIDLGFHKDIVPGDVALRKIQPESAKSEPVDLIADE